MTPTLQTLVEAAKSGQPDPGQPRELVQFIRDALADGWVPAFDEDAKQNALFAELLHTRSPLNMSMWVIGPRSDFFIRVVRPAYGLTALVTPPYNWDALTAKAERIE